MENFKYSMAASMGNNPVLYSIYTMGSMLEDLTGGISIPAISVMGSGFDLETTVADLMQDFTFNDLRRCSWRAARQEDRRLGRVLYT